MACLLIIFLFPKVNWNVQALNVEVEDEDDSIVKNDFIVSDENMNPEVLGKDRMVILKAIEDETKMYQTLHYADIQNVKFFYDKGNKTIFTQIAIKPGNYHYTNGTTYGMAININPFQNAIPQITDADYIYKFLFDKGRWSEILAVQHTPGQQKILSTSSVNSSKFLNEKENYIRMNFDMNRIGKPEEFQVKFFTSANQSIPTGKSYMLIDKIPWIEIPTATISLSLEPEISKIYPQQPPIPEKIIVNSTSKIAHVFVITPHNKKCDVQHASSDYCWHFEGPTSILIPPSSFESIPVTLRAYNLSKISHDIFLKYSYFQLQPQASGGNIPTSISKPWHIKVGEFWPDLLQGVLEIPNKYPWIIGLISGTGSFFLGFFVSNNQEPLQSKIKKLFTRKKHSETK